MAETASMRPERVVTTDEPVRRLPDEADDAPAEGMGLCLSGGGYRAMLFHLGGLWRLNEAGLLPKLQRISSVSGGSLTAGVLGMNWRSNKFAANGVWTSFVADVVAPLRGLADHTIDAGSILGGVLLPGSVADKVANAYAKHLFGKKTLQDLPPDPPRFVINATNVQTGALWRFSRPYMADYRVGLIRNPKVTLAQAVAASSAFPPVLSPVELQVDPASFDMQGRGELFREPFNSEIVLSDGGVYDNLGLETVWKNFRTVLVSDAGAALEAEPDPKRDWGRHALRSLYVIDNQVRSLRKRQVIEAFLTKRRAGAYWGIRSHVADFKVADALPCPDERVQELAATPTRLKRLPADLQERLINWGYAVCDAAIRGHVDASIARPNVFPYPRGI